MKELSYKSLSCSSELIYRFKKRSGKIQKQGCGKTNSLSEKSLQEGYETCNIFNIDKTGFFFCLVPNKTWTCKIENCHRGNQKSIKLAPLSCMGLKRAVFFPIKTLLCRPKLK